MVCCAQQRSRGSAALDTSGPSCHHAVTMNAAEQIVLGFAIVLAVALAIVLL